MSIVGGNTIVEPVSIADLQTILSSGDNSVKNLCQNQNIRMWAKFRPVEFKSRGRVGDNWVKQIPDVTTTSEAYSRASVAYGISCVPVWASRSLHAMTNFWSGYNTAYANIPSTIDKDGNTQIQTIPSGGYWQMSLPTSVGRLTDFVSKNNPSTKGYFHGAKEPIGGISNISIEITPAGYLTLSFTKNEEGVSDGLTVTYEDLVSCGMLYGFPNNANIYNYYFGVALVKLNSSGQPTSTVYVLTQNTTMASFQAMGASVTGIVTDDSFEGSYAVWPFISNVVLRGNNYSGDYYRFLTSDYSNCTTIALYDKEYVNITIRWAHVNVSVLAAYISPNHATTINVNYTVSNNMTDYPVTGVVVKLEFLAADGSTVIYTAANQTINRIESQSSASGSYSHNFQNGEQDLIKTVRATVTSLQGVVFYRPNESVMIAPVDMRSA